MILTMYLALSGHARRNSASSSRSFWEAPRRAASRSKCRSRVLEGERLSSLFAFEDFLGHGPEVAVLAIDGFESASLGCRQASQRLPDERPSDPEDAFLDAGKGPPGEEEGGAGSIFDRKRTQIVACQTHLFSFLGGPGHGLADLSKAAHRSLWRRHFAGRGAGILPARAEAGRLSDSRRDGGATVRDTQGETLRWFWSRERSR